MELRAIEWNNDRQWRDGHVGRLLLRAHRAYSARAVQMLVERGYDDVTVAHIGLLPHLDAEGTRVSTLATRSGMTKQGMGQLVQELERHGYLKRSPDPADGRASIVAFTPRGTALLEAALTVTRDLERDYAELLGEAQFDAFREALLTVVTIPPGS